MGRAAYRCALPLIAAAMVSPGPAWAEPDYRAICNFSDSRTSDLDATTGKYSFFETSPGSTMQMVFSGLSPESAEAMMQGNSGLVPVMTMGNAFGSFQILEITGTGNFNITTILDMGRKDTRQFAAAHSRHIQISDGIALISQWIGVCTVTPE